MAVVYQSVGIMNVFDEFVAEIASAQSDNVKAGIGYRLFSSDDEWRNILARTAASLNHRVASDMAELVYENHTAQYGIVVYNNLTSQFRGVAHNDSVAEYAVMCYVRIFHYKVSAADNSLAF